MVSYIHCDGDPEVRYNTNHIFKFNVDAVSKVCIVITSFSGNPFATDDQNISSLSVGGG